MKKVGSTYLFSSLSFLFLSSPILFSEGGRRRAEQRRASANVGGGLSAGGPARPTAGERGSGQRAEGGERQAERRRVEQWWASAEVDLGGRRLAALFFNKHERLAAGGG